MTDTNTSDESSESTAAADENTANPTQETPEPAVAPQSEAVVSTQPQVTLREFMMRLSLRDKRVELINAFNYSESAAGRVKDYESEFASRFTAFSQQVIEE